LRSSLVVGRICTPSARKWPTELVPFYRDLSERHPEVRWEFVGCPTDLQARLGEAVSDRATFVPASFEARRRYWNWDVLLYHHPTLTETFGRTVAEAMRAGCIPVVDDRGGFREQIAEGTGFLCAELAEFSSALSQLEEMGERRGRSRRCRAHADERFSLERFRRELREKFRSAAERQPETRMGELRNSRE
jgi:glycosyltransferase involved in cell wall biosynthesis